MYADDTGTYSGTYNRSIDKAPSRSGYQESEAPISDWSEVDVPAQFRFSHEESDTCFGPGSQGRRRCFVKKAVSDKLTRSGPQPTSAEVAANDPYFR